MFLASDDLNSLKLLVAKVEGFLKKRNEAKEVDEPLVDIFANVRSRYNVD
jgi:hypothetical protein